MKQTNDKKESNGTINKKKISRAIVNYGRSAFVATNIYCAYKKRDHFLNVVT